MTTCAAASLCRFANDNSIHSNCKSCPKVNPVSNPARTTRRNSAGSIPNDGNMVSYKRRSPMIWHKSRSLSMDFFLCPCSCSDQAPSFPKHHATVDTISIKPLRGESRSNFSIHHCRISWKQEILLAHLGSFARSRHTKTRQFCNFCASTAFSGALRVKN